MDPDPSKRVLDETGVHRPPGPLGTVAAIHLWVPWLERIENNRAAAIPKTEPNGTVRAHLHKCRRHSAELRLRNSPNAAPPADRERLLVYPGRGSLDLFRSFPALCHRKDSTMGLGLCLPEIRRLATIGHNSSGSSEKG
jgi:hypothetical protein